MHFTGKRCVICKSEHAERISRDIIDGVPYHEIIAEYPELKLYDMLISRHRKHFVEEFEIAAATKLSDHAFIDLLRTVGGAYLLKAQQGKELSMVQSRLAIAASNAICQRYRVEDAQAESKSIDDLLKRASQSKWKYAEVDNV